MRIWARRVGIAALFLFALPILLFVLQPELELGAWGLALGTIGTVLSPMILFGAFFLWARSRW